MIFSAVLLLKVCTCSWSATELINHKLKFKFPQEQEFITILRVTVPVMFSYYPDVLFYDVLRQMSKSYTTYILHTIQWDQLLLLTEHHGIAEFKKGKKC